MDDKPAHGIRCPSCGNPTDIIKTKPRRNKVLRRHRCRCGWRLTTEEKVLPNSASMGPPITPKAENDTYLLANTSPSRTE
jgi:hypothetical protein